MEGSVMTNTQLLAVYYAALGIKVFPVRLNAMGRKVPMTKHGFKDASSDINEVEGMFTPAATMIGAVHDFATVVDIDSEEGERNFKTIEHRLPKPKCVVHTRKGRHLYFPNPKDTELKRHIRVLPGVDLLAGPNGYVMLPDHVAYTVASGSIESLLETK